MVLRILSLFLFALLTFAQTGPLDYVKSVKNKPEADARDFNYRYTVGTKNLIGSLASAGSNSLTIYCPLGIATGQYVYISGGTGTAESVPISATNCNGFANGPGTITFTTANTHTGSWVLQSATSGIQEAFKYSQLTGSFPRTVLFTGDNNIYGPITVPAGYQLSGTGQITARLHVRNIFPLAAAGVIIYTDTTTTAVFDNFTMLFEQNTGATLLSQLVQYPAGIQLSTSYGGFIRNITILRAWTAVDLSQTQEATSVRNTFISAYAYGIFVERNQKQIELDNVNIGDLGISGSSSATVQNTNCKGVELRSATQVNISNSNFSACDQGLISASKSSFYSELPGVSITATRFYQGGGLQVSEGTVTCVQCTFDAANKRAFNYTGGNLAIHNSTFNISHSLPYVTTGQIMAYDYTQSRSMRFSFTNNFVTTSTAPTNFSAFQIIGPLSPNPQLLIHISGNQFELPKNSSDVTYKLLDINFTGIRGQITDNTVWDVGTGTFTFASFSNDVKVNLVNNLYGPGVLSLPGGYSQIISTNNR